MRTGKISKKLKEKARVALERREKQKKERLKKLIEQQRSDSQFIY